MITDMEMIYRLSIVCAIWGVILFAISMLPKKHISHLLIAAVILATTAAICAIAIALTTF